MLYRNLVLALAGFTGVVSSIPLGTRDLDQSQPVVRMRVPTTGGINRGFQPRGPPAIAAGAEIVDEADEAD
ncbi:hypothetical protein F5Y00DRAFT_260364 [Daldinia vernicosa]|uniref:uncharacterized protein n=1 Tax=Daldinia vernicosa TaxID=114800 RepID=UPI002008AC2E|nr:uncharacterized protein F5Y00DRAFT_260364 [Daldinia vernicosa]KAI0850491.1 hypothetical protein F5Y00DRAFT_260364 [Daldinia vernicosa]